MLDINKNGTESILLPSIQQLKSQFRCGIQLDISWLALNKLSNFNGVQYGLFCCYQCLGKAPVVSLLCHAVVTWDTKCSLSVMFSVQHVVDVLTNACIAWSQGQGGRVLCTGEELGTPFRTYSNLFLIRIIFVADGVFCLNHQKEVSGKQSIVKCC